MSKIKIIFTIACMFIALVGFSLTTHAATYKYDDLGRVIEVTYSSGKTVTYTYDAGGNVLTMVSTPALVNSIALDLESYSMEIGETHNTKVTVTYSNGTTNNVTGNAKYTSSDTSVATVSDNGVVTAIAGGQATITVAFADTKATATVTVLSQGIEAPTNLTVTEKTAASITLTWTAPGSSIPAVGYEVYRNGLKVLNTTSTNFVDKYLKSGTKYTYTVKAYDAEGNLSLASDEVSAVTNVSGTIISDEVWTKTNGPITVESNVTVSSGVYLQIDEGTEVLFMPGAQITVEGTLCAAGTAEDKVIFTSVKDPQIGGTGVLTSSDYWNGIIVASTGELVGDNIKVNYGKVGLNVRGKMSLSNSTVSNSSNIGIYLNSVGDVSILNNTIENSGSTGIYLYNLSTGVLTVSNNNISNNKGYPVYIYLNNANTSAFKGFANNTYTGNIYEGFSCNAIVLEGKVYNNVTLTRNTYILKGITTVSSNATLTIEPGTVIKSFNDYVISSVTYQTELKVEGKLIALGTIENPIVFTSIKDPEYGGTLTSPYNWNGIVVTSTGELVGENIKVNYGKVGLNIRGKMSFSNSTVSNSSNIGIYVYSVEEVNILNNTVESSARVGIYLYGQNLQPTIIRNNTITANGLSGIGIATSGTGTLTIENNTISNNTSKGIDIYSHGTGVLTVNSNNISNNKGYPVYVRLDNANTSTFKGFTNNDYTENTYEGFSYNEIVLGGNVNNDVILTNSTYILKGITAVSSNATLTIEPGTVIKNFYNYVISNTSYRTEIKVEGKLIAQGTSENPVVFTSVKDPEYGGTITSPYNWNGIIIMGTGEFYGDHIKVDYAINGFNVQGKLTLTNSMVTNSSNFGVYLNTLIQSVITRNSFKNNKNYGLYNYKFSQITVDATNNYWGSSGGPSVYNSTTKMWEGDGDKVGDGIIYNPWIETEN